MACRVHPVRLCVVGIHQTWSSPLFVALPDTLDNPTGFGLFVVFGSLCLSLLHIRNAHTDTSADPNKSHLCILYAGRLQVKNRSGLTLLEPCMDHLAVANVDAGMEEGVCAFVTEQHQITNRR